jgi:hypothetical protein
MKKKFHRTYSLTQTKDIIAGEIKSCDQSFYLPTDGQNISFKIILKFT